LKNNKLILFLSSIWALSILALGAWWLYLINKFSKISDQSQLPNPENLNKMVIWEGGTFVVLLILISATLLFYYLKDQVKTKSLQTFFAGLTHELKTPLASIRLQAEVISNFATSSQSEKLIKLSKRMVEDTQGLDTQMDKILQLSRIEQGGLLNPTQINPYRFLKNLAAEWSGPLNVEIKNLNQFDNISADEFALELIFKNLFENTKIHTESSHVLIELSRTGNMINIHYKDSGNFNGDKNKLATLFYKHNSSKGSGIGLYLCKKLMDRMGGKLVILTRPSLSFQLLFLEVNIDEE
jgi:signal transduction histidine kinase